jgi:hypothetical protein
MARAYEVIRRGEEEKTIIVPITGEMPNRPAPPTAGGMAVRDDDDEPTEHRIDLPEGAGWQRKPPEPPPAGDKIPLE